MTLPAVRRRYAKTLSVHTPPRRAPASAATSSSSCPRLPSQPQCACIGGDLILQPIRLYITTNAHCPKPLQTFTFFTPPGCCAVAGPAGIRSAAVSYFYICVISVRPVTCISKYIGPIFKVRGYEYFLVILRVYEHTIGVKDIFRNSQSPGNISWKFYRG